MSIATTITGIFIPNEDNMAQMWGVNGEYERRGSIGGIIFFKDSCKEHVI